MKEKIFTMDNGKRFSALDQIIINDKAYIFATEINDNGDDLTNNFVVLNIKQENGQLLLNDIIDQDERNKIVDIFIQRLKNK